MDERKTLMEMNTRDFNVMRDMLSEIERKIMHIDPLRQFEFYKPLQSIIFMAWEDACDPNNKFLTATATDTGEQNETTTI